MANNDTKATRSTSLRTKLLRSHLLASVIGIAMLAVTLAVTIRLRGDAERMARVDAPTAQASMQALEGVQQTLADLRGWMVLNDKSLRVERKQAWDDKIDLALERLNLLSDRWIGTQNSERLAEVTLILADLKEEQWWIEDVAHTPGNEPAHMHYLQNVAPSADSIFAIITSLIDIERELPSGSLRKEMLATMADVRGFFTSSRTTLIAFVKTGSNDDEVFFRAALNRTTNAIAQLADQVDLMTPEQSNLMALLKVEMLGYKTHSSDVIKMRSSGIADVSHYLLQNRAKPLADRANELLTKMSSEQGQLMLKDAERIGTISDLAIVIAVILIGTMTLVSWVIAQRGARRITDPLNALSRATKEMSMRRTTEDIPVTSDDELGQLTISFNSMRLSLNKSDQALEKRTRELEDARHLAEAAERQLNLIIDWAPNGMLMIDTSGTIVLANTELETMFGYAREEIIGQPIEFLVPESIRPQHVGLRDGYINQPRIRKLGEGGILYGQRNDGELIPVDIVLGPVQLEEGLHILAVVVDITEIRRKEQQLAVQADRLKKTNDALVRSNRDLDDFAYIASHDLKEPLRGIANYSTFLAEDHGEKLDQDGRDKLETLKRLCQRMENLIDTLLRYSRVGRADLAIQQTDLNQVVSEVIGLIHVTLEEKNIDLRIPAKLPTIRCDSVRVRELLNNLIGNAIKYNNKPDPWIEIGSEEQTLPLDDGETTQRVFYVRDNGIGIREKHIDSIFRIFKRLHGRDKFGGGTGAGLTFAKQIVERHNGKIWVESKFGEGTTIYFTLEIGKEV